MKRIFKNLVFSCTVFFCGLTANAQEKYPFALSFEPMYFFNNALRVNLEKKVAQRDWLGLNVTGYYSPLDPDANDRSITSNSDFEYIDGLRGLGLGGTYKHYFTRICFIDLGAGYTFFDVRNEGFDYNYSKFIEDGLVFYEYGEVKKHQYFGKVMVNTNFGIHSTFRHLFFVEPYVGMGWAYSFYDHSYQEKYNETMFGFGYRGPYLLMGLKLGFNIPPVR
jgi:hypothetical protein